MIQLLAQFNIRVLPLKTVLLTPHTPNLNQHFSQNSQKCGLATVLPDSVSNSILYYLLSETVARNSVPSSSPSQPPFDTSCLKIELCDNSVHRTTDPKGSASMGHDIFILLFIVGLCRHSIDICSEDIKACFSTHIHSLCKLMAAKTRWLLNLTEIIIGFFFWWCLGYPKE